MRRARVLVIIALSCAVWWACTEAGDPTGAGHSSAVGIVPSFQVDPVLFPADPVDRIRLDARDAATRALAGSTDQSVSPTATQWSLSLGIDLAGQETRSVIVEAQLFSGSTVVWSGRLGPFTVPTSAPALSLDVYRGPLDNLDVTAITVTGAASQLVAGASVPLTANLTLVAGSDASPVVFWASTDPAVATVTPSGPTATLTAVAAGTTSIIATAGTQDFEFTLEVLPPGSASKTWIGGAATAPTAWSEPANWSPTGVPAATDGVLVPATANDPLLAAPVSVNGLRVQSGATLDLGGQALSVSADLQADGDVVNGQVGVTGSGTILQGNVDDLLILASRAATGPIDVTGSLVMTAPFAVGANLIDILGDLTTSTGGRLTMTTAGGIVSVGGDAVFSGLSELGFLTAGQLHVDGDFVVVGPDPEAYAATGTHSVSLNGTSLQTIDMQNPGATTQRLNDLFIDNTGGVDLAGDAYAAGDVVVSSALTVASGQSFDIGGTLTLEAGSTLNVDGTVTATSCVNLGAAITGSGTHPCTTPPATRTWVGGASGDVTSWTNADNWSPAGVPDAQDTVLVQGASYNPVLQADATIASITVGGINGVDLGGFTLSVSGDADAGNNGMSNGLVRLTGPGTVTGYFQNLEVSGSRQLSGILYIGGDLSVLDVLDVNANTVSISGALTVQGAGTLAMNDPADYVIVYGAATFDGADHDGSLTEGTLVILSDLTVTASSTTAFASSGNQTVQLSANAPQSISFAQPGQIQQRFNDLQVLSDYGTTFTTDAYATGDVSVTGRMVVPAGVTVTIDGTLTLELSATLQVDAGGTLIAGDCVDNGALILGSGTLPCGLLPVTADKIWVGGAPFAETLWDEPANWTPAGAPQSFESVLIPSTSHPPALNGATAVGSLDVRYGTSLDLGGFTLSVSTDLSVQGSAYNGLIEVVDVGTLFEGTLDDLRLDVPRALSGQMLLSGNADLRGKLTIGAQNMYVSGDLATSGAGQVDMADPNGTLQVGANVTFGGLSTDMTAGLFYVGGDLDIRTAWTAGAQVYIVGDVDQTVTLSDPGTGAGQQYFAGLYTANGAGVVTFVGNVFVTGSFYSYNGILAGNGSLNVGGTFYASGTTFDGIPVRIDTSQPPESHVIDSVTFTGYDPNADTQLFLRMPASTTPLTLTSPVFQTAPNQGFGYYIEADNTIVGGQTLTINLNGPTPTSVLPQLYKVDADTQLNWGP